MRIGLVNVKGMLEDALNGQYAVGHFDVHNIEWVQAVITAAEELSSPVILGVTEQAVNYFGGFSVVHATVTALIKEMNATVPIALHLDHGSSVENCIAAIEAGFSSVMIDGSHYPFEENVAMTQAVVEYAHPRGITVEAEVGSIGGQEGRLVSQSSIYAEVTDCENLVKLTGIDSLAPSLGTVHGLYKGEPKVDFERMHEIQRTVKIPLVLHGASGLYPDQIKKAISFGTAKINVNADNHIAFTRTVRDILNNNQEIYSVYDYVTEGQKSVKEKVKEKIRLFGSENKAI